MPQSMTGFGRAALEHEGGSINIEAKSYNNRFLKVTLRLPDALSNQELELENFVRQKLTRGSVYITVGMTRPPSVNAYRLNVELVRRYYSELFALARELDAPKPSLSEIARLDGAVEAMDQGAGEDEALSEAVKKVLNTALGELSAMRTKEGEALRADLEARVKRVSVVSEEVEKRAPKIVGEYRDKLKARMEQLLKGTGVAPDEAVIVREAALFADRADITEETTRLRHHCGQFLKEIAGKEAVGRKLDFIAQEMLRESNTIGSKANDAELASSVVEMKSEIERIKEQVQNLE
ncbi:MAG: YicC family protein [Planctomycetes bacterium]|nr:YicC family protein [Planctomycetota bacterium]